MTNAFKDMLSGMSDTEINALDSTTMDAEAREILAIEVANRNRANEMREIEDAIERGSSVQQGNSAPKKFLYLVVFAIAIILFWVYSAS